MQPPDELLRQINEADKTEAENFGQLPPTTRLFVDVEGTRGRRYKGEFIFKVPTLADQIQMGRIKSAYLPQGAIADANAAILAEQICFLAVTLQDPKPEWWKPFEMYDAAPVGALYQEALIYERKFHGKAEDADDAQSGAEQAEHAEGDGSESTREARVGRKVQPPAERRETIVSHDARGG